MDELVAIGRARKLVQGIAAPPVDVHALIAAHGLIFKESDRLEPGEAGNTVTVTIGGNSYTATVQSDLSWSVSVPESVLTALGNGDLTVSATVTNGHGNTGTG